MNPRANRGSGISPKKVRDRWPKNLKKKRTQCTWPYCECAGPIGDCPAYDSRNNLRKDHNNTKQKNLSERGKGGNRKRVVG